MWSAFSGFILLRSPVYSFFIRHISLTILFFHQCLIPGVWEALPDDLHHLHGPLELVVLLVGGAKNSLYVYQSHVKFISVVRVRPCQRANDSLAWYIPRCQVLEQELRRDPELHEGWRRRMHFPHLSLEEQNLLLRCLWSFLWEYKALFSFVL